MKVKLSKYAKMSGVSVRTLWRRIKDGSLKVEYSDTGRVSSTVIAFGDRSSDSTESQLIDELGIKHQMFTFV